MHSSKPQSLSNLSWNVARRCEAANCVMIATNGAEFFIGDSKSPEGLVLTYTRDEWKAFVSGVKEGDFDHLIE
jgi:Domain of unknown function (DUF397)